jgi:hypothetical protein
MIKIIEDPKIKEMEKYFFNPLVTDQTVGATEILRIEIERKFTRIDFICYARLNHFESFEWIHIMPETFIRPSGSAQEHTLIKAINIPLAPQKYYFKTSNDFLCYTLYFPKLPNDVKTIDIIEKEVLETIPFSFYGVSLESIRKEKLVVGN